MAPEIEETTPEAVETTSEAPPVAPEETGAEPSEPEVSVLAEFRAARKAEAEGIAAEDDPPVETPSEEVAATSEEEPAVETATVDPSKHVFDPDTGEVLDRRTRAAKRIEVLLKERHELRRQLSKQAPQSEPVAPPQPTAPPAETAQEDEPKFENFSKEKDPYAAFSAATARYHAQAEFQKQVVEQKKVGQKAQLHAEVQQAQDTWDGKLDEVRKRLPDFDQAYTAMYETLPNDGRQRPLVETLLTSSIGHEMAHYLGTHPQVVTDLYNKPSLKAHIRALGKLEAQVEAAIQNHTASPVLNPVGAPPPPIRPVGAATTSTNYDSRSATLAQFRKRHGVRGGRRNV